MRFLILLACLYGFHLLQVYPLVPGFKAQEMGQQCILPQSWLCSTCLFLELPPPLAVFVGPPIFSALQVPFQPSSIALS